MGKLGMFEITVITLVASAIKLYVLFLAARFLKYGIEAFKLYLDKEKSRGELDG